MKAYHTLEIVFNKLTHLSAASNNIKSELLSANFQPSLQESKIEQICTLESIKYDILTSDFIHDLFVEAKKEANTNYTSKLELGYKIHQDTKSIPFNLLLEYTKSSLKCAVEWPTALKNKSFKHILLPFTSLIKVLQDILALQATRFSCTKYEALLKLNYSDINTKLVEKVFSDFGHFLKSHFTKIKQKHTPNFFDEKPLSFTKKFALVSAIIESFKLPLTCFSMQNNVLHIKSEFSNDIRLEGSGSILLLLRSLFYELGKIAYRYHNKNWSTNLTLFNNFDNYFEASYGFIFSQQILPSKSFEEFVLNFKIEESSVDKKPFISSKKISDYKGIVHISPLLDQSDDLTGMVHTMLRYSLEKELIEGNIEVKDLPEAWNEDIKYYFGITPKNDSEGCLQEKNWFQGIFGGNAIYLLSSILGYQLLQDTAAATKELNNFISLGNFGDIFSAITKISPKKGNEIYPSKLIKAIIKGNHTYMSPYKKYFIERYNI